MAIAKKESQALAKQTFEYAPAPEAIDHVKIQPAATLPVVLVMQEAIRDFVRETGRSVGFKAAGGIRTAKQAIAMLVVTYETLGADWMTPERLRLGASSLLNDVLMQIDKERTGAYQSLDYFTID